MVYITCFTLKEKSIDTLFLLYFFVGICLPQCSFFFLADFLTVFFGKALGNYFVTRCSILDVAGVLYPPQYAPTWIAHINNLIQYTYNL